MRFGVGVFYDYGFGGRGLYDYGFGGEGCMVWCFAHSLAFSIVSISRFHDYEIRAF